ncbi:tape measure protein [Leuconostoc citreum]|uniref:tape measure protein n=1 Tax=Leuconostoc citreum TaxID=33964 RepID=UPI0032DF388B
MAESYSVSAVFSLKDNLSNRLKSISDNMAQVAEKPKRISAGLGTILKGAGVFSIVNKGVSLLTSNIGGAVSRFDKLNNFPKVMSAMGASTQDSTAAMKKMSNAIDGLPTSLDDIASTAQNLFPIMKNDIGKASDSAIALNNAFLASGASGADASRGLQQYTQMLSAGKVDMQSWKTLQETMPYALQQTAKSFGIASGSSQELYEKLKSGEITMDQLNDKFIELNGGANGFANVAKTATGGIGTAFTNLGNRVKKGLADVIEALDKASVTITGSSIAYNIGMIGTFIKDALTNASKSISDFANKAKPYFDVVKNAFSQMAPAVKAAIDAVVQSLSIMNNQTSSSKSGIDSFKGAMNNVVGVVKTVSQFIQDNSDKIASLIRLLPALAVGWLAFKVGSSVIGNVTSRVVGLISVFNNFSPLLSGIGNGFINTFNKARSSIGSFISTSGQIISKYQGISDAASILRRNGTGTFEAMRVSTMAYVPSSQGVMVAIGQMSRKLSALKDTGVNAFTGMLSGIKGVPSAMLNAVKHPITSIGSLFLSLKVTAVSSIRAIGVVIASNPIGLALTVITLAVVAFATAWTKNIGHIREYTGAFLNAIKNAFMSIGNIFKPMMSSLQPLMPLLKGLAVLLGGVLLAPLALLASAVTLLVDGFRALMAVLATVVIAIRSLVTAVAKGGVAIAKFLTGDVKGAAQEAKGAVKSIGSGINDIKDTWSAFGKDSATAGVINGFKKVGQETDKNSTKAKKAEDAFTQLGVAGSKATTTIGSSLETVSSAMQSAFSSEKMSGYTKSASEITKRFADDTKVANTKLEESIKSSGTKRIALTNEAMQGILDVQGKRNGEMIALMNDNKNMLVTNKDLEGNQLTESQRNALMQQNEAIRNGLMQQQELYIQAAQTKIANGQKLSQTEIQAVQSNLNALYQNQTETITTNEEQIKALKDQMAQAETASQKANYQAQIDALSVKNEQMSVKQNEAGVQMFALLQQQGSLNSQTVADGLNNMHATTDQQLSGIYQAYVNSGASIDQQLTVLKGIMQQRGFEASSGLMNALKTGDFSQVGQQKKDEVIRGLSTLPPEMFKNGDSGKNKLIDGLKNNAIKVSDAGEYINSLGSRGADKAKGKYEQAGSTSGESLRSGIASKGGSVQNAGSDLAGKGAQGARSQKSAFESVGGFIGNGLAEGLRASFPAVASAAEALVGVAKKAAQAVAKIHSPSRLFRDEVGKYIAQGVAVGINDNASEAEIAMSNLIEQTNQKANSGFNFDVNGSGQIEMTTDNSTFGLLQEIKSAIQKGQVIMVDSNKLVGATAHGYDAELGNIFFDKGRNQL